MACNDFEEKLDKYNNTTGNSILTQIQAQFDQLIHGLVTMVNDAFCPNISQDLTGISGVDANGNAVNLQDGQIQDPRCCKIVQWVLMMI